MCFGQRTGAPFANAASEHQLAKGSAKQLPNSERRAPRPIFFPHPCELGILLRAILEVLLQILYRSPDAKKPDNVRHKQTQHLTDEIEGCSEVSRDRYGAIEKLYRSRVAVMHAGT